MLRDPPFVVAVQGSWVTLVFLILYPNAGFQQTLVFPKTFLTTSDWAVALVQFISLPIPTLGSLATLVFSVFFFSLLGYQPTTLVIYNSDGARDWELALCRWQVLLFPSVSLLSVPHPLLDPRFDLLLQGLVCKARTEAETAKNRETDCLRALAVKCEHRNGQAHAPPPPSLSHTYTPLPPPPSLTPPSSLTHTYTPPPPPSLSLTHTHPYPPSLSSPPSPLSHTHTHTHPEPGGIPGTSSSSVRGCLLKGSVWELSRCREMIDRSITVPLGSITGSFISVSIRGSAQWTIPPTALSCRQDICFPHVTFHPLHFPAGKT